ncbi:mitochondrial K+-H+ exchange-related-domain-containing protein [Lipomyces oligophaga]|uniref:mitochondrial K+-H+ exchange-related-domain-containing protein n=1 Tax=Lipomyces oligophaga TaxID=45792 RepID=UPI0034CD0B5E
MTRIIVLPLTTARRLIITQRTEAHFINPRRPRIDDRLTQRAQKMWSDWEKSSTWWKQKVTAWGAKVLDQVPYEEWSLKAVPQAPVGLFPVRTGTWWIPWSRQNNSVTDSDDKSLQVRTAGTVTVPIVYPVNVQVADPASVTTVGGDIGEAVALDLKNWAVQQSPIQIRKLLICAAISPLTLPIALLPVIPNLPGFYLLFRVFSHFKAYEGAQQLRRIVDEKRYVPEPNHALGAIYTEQASSMQDALVSPSGERTLLESESVEKLTKLFDAADLSDEVRRAIAQTRTRISKEITQATMEERRN